MDVVWSHRWHVEVSKARQGCTVGTSYTTLECTGRQGFQHSDEEQDYF